MKPILGLLWLTTMPIAAVVSGALCLVELHRWIVVGHLSCALHLLLVVGTFVASATLVWVWVGVARAAWRDVRNPEE